MKNAGYSRDVYENKGIEDVKACKTGFYSKGIASWGRMGSGAPET
jgi:hypothetical protein